LQGYDKDNIEEDRVKKLQEFILNPKFKLDHLKTISEIASNLAAWVIAMDKYYAVNLIVKPKKISLAAAQAKYNEIDSKLKIKQEELRIVQEKVDALRTDLKKT
jgi:dynein heavy chain